MEQNITQESCREQVKELLGSGDLTKTNLHRMCSKRIMAIHDTMDVLNGKWKIAIISVLAFGERRYSELLREVNGISGKVLSRELKDLEQNLLVKRTILDTQPVTVKYELTPYCDKLLPIIENLAEWGTSHRQIIIGK